MASQRCNVCQSTLLVGVGSVDDLAWTQQWYLTPIECACHLHIEILGAEAKHMSIVW